MRVAQFEKASMLAVNAGSPRRKPALAAIGGSATNHRYCGLAVASCRARRVWNPDSVVGVGRVLALRAFHEFRRVRPSEHDRHRSVVPLCTCRRRGRPNDPGPEHAFRGDCPALWPADEIRPRRSQP